MGSVSGLGGVRREWIVIVMNGMSELEEMIKAGWEDRRLDQIPANWRNMRPEPLVSDFFNPKPAGMDQNAFGTMCSEVKRWRTLRPQVSRRIKRTA